METIDLDTILSRRASRRQRLLRATPIIAIIPLVAAAVAYAILIRSAVPTAPTSLGPSVNPIVMTNASFGALLVNGTPVRGIWPISVRMRRGRDVFRIDAPPFQPVSCSLPWPLDMRLLSGASGSYARDGSAPPPPRALGSGACAFTWGSIAGSISSVQVDLPVTAADLPPAPRAAAIATVSRALASITVPPTPVAAGDYYASGLDAQGQTTTAVAAAPLVEWGTLAPDTAGDLAARLCGDLSCPASYEFGYPFPKYPTWSVGEAVQITLHFADQAHHVVSVVRMPFGVSVGLTLVLGADGTWTPVGPLSAGAAVPAANMWPRLNPCFEGKEVLSQRFNSSGALVAPLNLVGVDGCLLEATLSYQGAPVGHFLWRFGVLLAIDAPAHQLLPNPPIAPPAETTPTP